MSGPRDASDAFGAANMVGREVEKREGGPRTSLLRHFGLPDKAEGALGRERRIICLPAVLSGTPLPHGIERGAVIVHRKCARRVAFPLFRRGPSFFDFCLLCRLPTDDGYRMSRAAYPHAPL